MVEAGIKKNPTWTVANKDVTGCKGASSRGDKQVRVKKNPACVESDR